jgi:uncharacterized membrane protein YqaE (UPF0057 family)
MLNNIKHIKDHIKDHSIYINGKNYIIDIINGLNNKNISTIKDLISYLQINDNYLNIYKNYFILYNNRLISNEILIETLFYDKKYKTNIINIELIEKQKGGGFLDIFQSIIDIGKFFIKLGDFVVWFGKFILWVVKFFWWFFVDFLNPVNFVTDFFKSIMLITVTICKIPFELIMASFKICINIIGGWMQGFWGWDMSSLTKADKNSPYFKSFNRTAGQKIYYTQQNTVPFSIILGTILCPPMGVFMDMGTTGWLNIIICCLLTLLFYLPGLCYALLIIYS